ncbi:MAG: choice-of-anchor D domain-containing protein [Terriglobales bacterium]
MQTISLPPRVHVQITGESQRRKRKQSSRFASGLLLGAGLVLLYLHISAEPKLQLSSSRLDFPPVSVGSLTATQNITLTNVGGAVLHLSSVAINDDESAEFQHSQGCAGASVQPLQSCTIEVSLRPSDTGARSAKLVITSDTDEKTTTIPLSGAGLAPSPPDLTADPPALSFQESPGATATQPLVLRSTGASPATITAISWTGPKTVTTTQDCVNKQIAVSASCRVEVNFSPSDTSTVKGTIDVTYGGAGKPAMLHVPVDAEATPPNAPEPAATGKLIVDPGQVSFPTLQHNQKISPIPVTISNQGDGPLQLRGVQLAKDAGIFRMMNGCAGMQQLEPHASCNVSIIASTAEVGTWPGQLIVSTRDEDRPIAISAQVLPETVVDAKLNPRLLRIRADATGFVAMIASSFARDSILELSSTGNAPLRIEKIEYTEPFYRVARKFSVPECRAGLEVPPNTSCQLAIGFRAGVPSTRQLLRVYDNAPTSPQSLELEGLAPAPPSVGTLRVPTEVDFGSVPVGVSDRFTRASASVNRAITLFNVGSGNLSLYPPQLRGDSSFRLISNGCGSALAPNASCTLTLAFQPVTANNFAAALEIGNNGTSGTRTVALHGSGSNPNGKNRVKAVWAKPLTPAIQ